MGLVFQVPFYMVKETIRSFLWLFIWIVRTIRKEMRWQHERCNSRQRL